jgi:protein phosphatase
MDSLARACHADPDLLLATPYRIVDVTDEANQNAAVAWWEELTARGGEGMVTKPLDFVTRDSRGLVQPALKTRGREYLRIIYGPEYDLPENLSRLRSRGLSAKRSLAAREFALGRDARRPAQRVDSPAVPRPGVGFASGGVPWAPSRAAASSWAWPPPR